MDIIINFSSSGGGNSMGEEAYVCDELTYVLVLSCNYFPAL